MWFDYWLPMGPICSTMGERVIYDSGLQCHAKVATIIRDGEWRWPLANSTELLTLKESIPMDMTPHMEDEDTIMWVLTASGDFTTKSAWMAIHRISPVTSWSKLVWFQGNFPRAAFILWMTIKIRLSTLDRFHNPQVIDTCRLCGNVQESHNHLFFECPMSARIWNNILRKGNMIVPHISWDNLIEWLSTNWIGTSLSCSILKLCLATTVYYIWQERNRRVHENHHQIAKSITCTILEIIRMWLSSYKHVVNNEINRKHQQDWALPDSIFAV